MTSQYLKVCLIENTACIILRLGLGSKVTGSVTAWKLESRLGEIPVYRNALPSQLIFCIDLSVDT